MLFGAYSKSFAEFEILADKAVRVEISSYGGTIYDMFGIIDRIRSSPCHVVTRGFGKIMSAATFILAAGDERHIGANSWVMVHEMSDSIKGKMSSLEIDMRHNDRMQKQMYKLYEDLSKGKTSAKQWAKFCAIDHYISSEEVLDLGLVDHVTSEA